MSRPALDSPARVGWVLYRRDLLATLFSPAIYIVLTVACLLLTFFTVSWLDTVGSLSVLVSTDPARLPLFICVGFLALYLGLTSSLSISSEREHRTFEVLFYGPVTASLRVVSIFLRDLSVFLLAEGVFLLDLWITSRLTNISLGPDPLRGVLRSFLLIGPMLGFSLLLSALTRRVRRAVLLFVSVFVLLAGLQIASGLLQAVPPSALSLFLLIVRRALSALLAALRWVSPFSYLARLNDPPGTGAPPGWTLLAAVLYTLLLLALAILALKKSDKSP